MGRPIGASNKGIRNLILQMARSMELFEKVVTSDDRFWISVMDKIDNQVLSSVEKLTSESDDVLKNAITAIRESHVRVRAIL